MKALHWRLIPFFIFLLLILLFLRGLELDPHHLPSAQIGKPLPEFSLNSMDDEVFTSDSMFGHVSLLNVWASWCMSCADEQLMLMQLADEGVPIYGLNYKDTPEN